MRWCEIVEWGLIVPGVNTTVDVGPDAIQKQATKFGNKVTRKGVPPSIWDTVKPRALTEGQDALGGFWIDEHGDLLECDHRSDWHHAQIALERFPPDEDDLDSDDPDDDGGDGAIYAAYESGWIRASQYGDSLGISWRQKPSRAAFNTLMRWLSAKGQGLRTFHVSAEGAHHDFKNWVDVRAFLRVLGRAG
jgi:hypothetical protein